MFPNEEVEGGMVITAKFDEDMDSTLCSGARISMDSAIVLHSNLGGQRPNEGGKTRVVGPAAPGQRGHLSNISIHS